MRLRRPLRRVHIWLGWLVGVPLLIWTASGLFMAAWPIEQVRGEHLLREAPQLALASPPVPPAIGPRPVRSLTLEQQHDGARWVIRYADGGARRADPATGRLLPPLGPADAAALVRSRYKGDAAIVAVDRTSSEKPPLELRRKRAAFRVGMADGTHFYVDAATGEVLARRSRLWRAFDIMWGLHIMDLQTREDINNPWLIGFSLLALVSIVMALVLLPIAVWKRRR